VQTTNTKFFLAFIPTDNFLTWHRAPLLEALRSQCEKSEFDFIVYQRPIAFHKRFISLFKKESSENPHYVKQLYTILPASLASKSRLAFLLFFVFPIFLQLRRYMTESSIVWFCKPSQFDFLKYFKGRFFFEIYDNYAADNKGLTFSEKQKLKKAFEDTIYRSQYAFFSSVKLFMESDKRKKVYFPNAVKAALIERAFIATVEDNVPKQVVIGFVGVLSNQINIKVLTTILKKKPEWKVQIVGKINGDVSDEIQELARLFPQLEIFGPYYYEDLYKYLPYFTVGICPYIDNDFNIYRNPMKIYEFAAFGVPTIVLGCQLDNEQAKFCYKATLDNVVPIIETAIKEKSRNYGEILKFARENTWEKRANSLRQYF
jgi:glycosyltransferase involved in cell wall biosynthesis